MASSSIPSRKKRGRKPAARVPCDDCIVRASKEHNDNASIELCDRCTAILNRTRNKPRPAAVHKVQRQMSAIIDTALGVRTDPVTLPWSEDAQEQHTVHFFVQHTAPELAGYFNSPFWQRMVLEAGRNEPTVKHAIAAIGSLHETLLKPGDVQSNMTQFAMEQCNKSIGHLMAPSKSGKLPDLRLMLTACVLYTSFESLQGHTEQAINHATHGYSLVQQYLMDPENKNWELGEFSVELNQLSLMMSRLQNKSKLPSGRESQSTRVLNPTGIKHPTQFNSLQEARSLELVLNQLTVYFMDLELDDEFYDGVVATAEKHSCFISWLKDWELAYSRFLTRMHPTMSLEERRAAMILKAHHLIAEILSEVDLSLGDKGWDAFHSKFSTIIELATVVVGSSPPSGHSSSATELRRNRDIAYPSTPIATLSFTLNIADPLYEVCARCRDPILRGKALELLVRLPRQECMRGSWSAWKVGKYLLNCDEDGPGSPPKHLSPENISNQAEIRLSESDLDMLGGPSTSTQTYRRRSSSCIPYAVPRAHPRPSLNPGLFQDFKHTGSSVKTGTLPTAYNEPSTAYLIPESLTENTSVTRISTAGPSFERFGPICYDYQDASGVMSQQEMHQQQQQHLVNQITLPEG